MRVLMTADAVGGVWTFALEAADALADRGVDVSLAVMGGRLSEPQRRQAHASALASLHESDLALEWMDDPWEDVARAGHWLLGLADQVRPDVVHLNGYVHAGLPWPAPTLVVAHSCVLTWWVAVHGEAAPASWAEYRRRVAAGLAAADAVVAPTRAFLDDLRRLYTFDGGTVIRNGRRDTWVVAVPKEPFVLGAGRLWDEAKNLAMLDAVAQRIDWPVVLAGDPMKPGADDRVRADGGRALRAAHGVGALPFEELAALLGRAAVFAHPARYEPFGLGPLEAALSGCALVLGDIPSLREVWEDAAAYVHPDDQKGLASVLDRLLAEPGLAAARGEDARRRAAAFRPSAMADAYVSAYRSLHLASARRP
jgi:glycosyltransferase involved in cell wall biosynthesis